MSGALAISLLLMIASCSYEVESFAPPRLSRQLLRQLQQQQQHRNNNNNNKLYECQIYSTRDADFVEMLVGGEHYKTVPLPDLMVDTTCFVGNQREFVKGDKLSDSMERAANQGFVYLFGMAYRRGRKGSVLASIHW